MKKIIEVDLDNKLEYLNKYDDDIINDELHEYILANFDEINTNVILKIKFNYDVDDNELLKIQSVFKKSFAIEFDKIKKN